MGGLWVLPCAGLQAPGNGLRPLRENRGITESLVDLEFPAKPGETNLRASCFCNRKTTGEYGDERGEQGNETEMEVAREAFAP